MPAADFSHLRVVPDPEPGPLTFDLCDHWVWGAKSEHRCTNYWREEIVLEKDADVGGHTMFGHYRAGTWRFCRTHARIFKRDRTDG